MNDSTGLLMSFGFIIMLTHLIYGLIKSVVYLESDNDKDYYDHNWYLTGLFIFVGAVVVIIAGIIASIENEQELLAERVIDDYMLKLIESSTCDELRALSDSNTSYEKEIEKEYMFDCVHIESIQPEVDD